MGGQKLALSVILLTHNQADILALQISSLERQSGINLADFEVIVTDDSSRDDELAKVEERLARTPLTCRLLRQHSDRFWATKARNTAIRAAQGKLLLFFDGDMIPELDAMAKHVATQAGREKHLLAGHRLRRRLTLERDDVMDFGRVIAACRAGGLPDPVVARWQRDEERRRSEFLHSKHPWHVIFSCHMSVRAAPEVLFDEHFVGWGPEDWELAYRLTHRHGYTVDFAPAIVAYEADHLGGGVANVFRTHTQEAIVDYLRNTFYFFDRCSGLEIEGVFWGLRKLKLEDDSWVITPTDSNYSLESRIAEARAWLISHGRYEIPPRT